MLRKQGTYVEYSVFGSDVSVDWSIISDDKELDVLGAHLGPHTWPAAIRMLESGILPMDDDLHPPAAAGGLPAAAWTWSASGKESVKVSLIP